MLAGESWKSGCLGLASGLSCCLDLSAILPDIGTPLFHPLPHPATYTNANNQNTNASIVKTLAEACAEHCPKAHILIISNPVNSTVPIFAEVYKQKGVFDEKRIFGVTTLDVVRASRFLGEIKNTDPKDVKVTVVGGHSGVTIIPLLSQVSHGKDVQGQEYKDLVKRIQFGGDEVVQAKAGTGSATLSMGFGESRLAFGMKLWSGARVAVVPVCTRGRRALQHPSRWRAMYATCRQNGRCTGTHEQSLTQQPAPASPTRSSAP